MECDLNGDSGDAMNSTTSASDRSALQANVPQSRSREEICTSSRGHNEPTATIRSRSSSMGMLRLGRMMPKIPRRERMRNALKLWRLRKRWEKEYDKER
ncbi:hypothetical protein FBUS_00361 [Fasciolopsis buskii]|uniref:Uncharacterized protein n=1 Tax=Fasciolopsis buskii TaxID=27845 RepID=A0A8E0S7Y2_9TREM|nr:hypothetical protein FBUS_00361 [Fasciolopsis buski]